MTTPRSRRNNGGTQALRQTAVVGACLLTGQQPIEIPPNGRHPLLQLPRLALSAGSQHVHLPEQIRCLAPRFKLVAKA